METSDGAYDQLAVHRRVDGGNGRNVESIRCAIRLDLNGAGDISGPMAGNSSQADVVTLAWRLSLVDTSHLQLCQPNLGTSS
ncbi:hypothetical protein IAQ61_000869 [Plenodomus lingam]|uniref:uncharacterized protein n=1 Tax=Leptosphaeria maculans TaxID=5022 RepID=UPI0033179885|nr:hypothetical protein IAQ61_000869 [Plenodomus lingam]